MVSDVAKMIAQTPALFEGLTGMKIGDLMAAVPALGEAIERAQANGNGRANRNGAGDGTRPFGAAAAPVGYRPGGAPIEATARPATGSADDGAGGGQ